MTLSNHFSFGLPDLVFGLKANRVCVMLECELSRFRNLAIRQRRPQWHVTIHGRMRRISLRGSAAEVRYLRRASSIRLTTAKNA